MFVVVVVVVIQIVATLLASFPLVAAVCADDVYVVQISVSVSMTYAMARFNPRPAHFKRLFEEVLVVNEQRLS